MGKRYGLFWSPVRNVRLRSSISEHAGEITIESNFLVMPAGMSSTQHVHTESDLNTALDHRPQILHGTLDDGAKVSLLDAQMVYEPPFYERFTGRRIVLGGHVGLDSLVKEVRWVFPALLGSQDSSELKIDAGRLSVWYSNELKGYRLDLKNPLPLIDAVELLPNYCASLVFLATGTEMAPALVEFDTVDNQSCNFGMPRMVERNIPSEFLECEHIGLREMASWLDRRATLGRYPFVHSINAGPVEVQGQMLATALEGLDRRMHSTDTIFTAFSKKERKDFRDAVTGAARDWLKGANFAELEVGVKAIRDAIVRAGEPSYVERVKRLLAPTFKLLPPLFAEDIEVWVRKVRDLRNDESHGISGAVLTYQEIDTYVAIVRTVRWALRLRLLQEVFDDATIRSAFSRSSELSFLFANLEAAKVWPKFNFTGSFLNILRSATQ